MEWEANDFLELLDSLRSDMHTLLALGPSLFSGTQGVRGDLPPQFPRSSNHLLFDDGEFLAAFIRTLKPWPLRSTILLEFSRFSLSGNSAENNADSS